MDNQLMEKKIEELKEKGLTDKEIVDYFEGLKKVKGRSINIRLSGEMSGWVGDKPSQKIKDMLIRLNAPIDFNAMWKDLGSELKKSYPKKK